jgi:hypothetical protein
MISRRPSQGSKGRRHGRSQGRGDLLRRANHTVLKRAHVETLAQPLHRALVFGHQHASVYHLHDRVIVALDRLAVPLEHRLFMRILLQAAPNIVPPVGMLRDHPQQVLLACPAHHNRGLGVGRGSQ